MKIEILGSGCAKCKKLEKNAQQAVKEMGIKAEVKKVEDIMEIANRGVLMTPAIVVDGVVKSSGKVLSPDEIKILLKR
jgi:small redox-active disulfide protein 2